MLSSVEATRDSFVCAIEENLKRFAVNQTLLNEAAYPAQNLYECKAHLVLMLYYTSSDSFLDDVELNDGDKDSGDH